MGVPLKTIWLIAVSSTTPCNLQVYSIGLLAKLADGPEPRAAKVFAAVSLEPLKQMIMVTLPRRSYLAYEACMLLLILARSSTVREQDIFKLVSWEIVDNAPEPYADRLCKLFRDFEAVSDARKLSVEVGSFAEGDSDASEDGSSASSTEVSTVLPRPSRGRPNKSCVAMRSPRLR